MKQIFYPANGRGTNDLGWLKANFSFSFEPHYNPEKIKFGVLRVLNDDVIAPGRGFGLHPHDNMEIITIPLAGAIEHRDSMGNTGVIRAGEVQIMSAGTGLQHSEYNYSQTESANTLQIWLYPKEMNIKPGYSQRDFSNRLKNNELTVIVSPYKCGETLWINQDATFSMGDFDNEREIIYEVKKPGNGVYIFVIEGALKINEQVLNKRDALGVYDLGSVKIETKARSRLLIMDVPMV
jgi:redox-sensitive bicupin YhaK (pirin superfamily)